MVSNLKEFVSHKIRLLDRKNDSYSKAACAKLRRAVGKSPGESPDVWDITLQGAPEGRVEQEVIHTVLTLYALHSQGKDESMNDGKTSFGTAIAGLIDPKNEASIRRRFNAVSTSIEFSELAHHARGLIQMLKAKNIKMDYVRFASDLFYFQHTEGRNSVRLRWGEDFYKANVDTEKNEGTEE